MEYRELEDLAEEPCTARIECPSCHAMVLATELSHCSSCNRMGCEECIRAEALTLCVPCLEGVKS